MTSRTSVAVIDDGGRFGGMVTLDSIRESLGHEAGHVTVLGQATNPIIRWEWIVDEWDQIWEALRQHLELTVLSVALGCVLAAILSAIALRFRVTAAPITGFTAFLYTIPSVALFGLLVPYLRSLNRATAVMPLAAYTLLILVTNTIAGFDAVPASVRESADGMGLTPTPAGPQGRTAVGPALHDRRAPHRRRLDGRARHRGCRSSVRAGSAG